MDISTLSLIGMPGAGKSTIGVLLAKRLGFNFVDTDLVIQVERGEPLQHTVDQLGFAAFCRLEEQVLLGLPLDRFLVATGGSVVLSESAMARLAAAGPVVFLDVPLATLRARVDIQPDRGIAFTPGQSLDDVFAERLPLYRQHATFSIDCGELLPDAIVGQIVTHISGQR